MLTKKNHKVCKQSIFNSNFIYKIPIHLKDVKNK